MCADMKKYLVAGMCANSIGGLMCGTYYGMMGEVGACFEYECLGRDEEEE
jgi:hypothetical protein